MKSSVCTLIAALFALTACDVEDDPSSMTIQFRSDDDDDGDDDEGEHDDDDDDGEQDDDDCDDDDSDDDDDVTRQQAVPTYLDGGAEVTGSKAKLKRRSNKLAFKVKTTVTPGYAYTLWVCGFNEPTQCTGPGSWTPSCSLSDLLAGNGDSFCQWGDGAVAPADGKVEFKANSNDFGELALGTGPSNFLGSEIVLVVREHGPVIPEIVDEMITTHDGGCLTNTCIDRQIGSFGAP